MRTPAIARSFLGVIVGVMLLSFSTVSGWIQYPVEETDYYYMYDDASDAPFTYPQLPAMPEAPYSNYTIHDNLDAVMLTPYNDRVDEYSLPDSFWFFGNWYRPGLDLFISPDGWLSFDEPPGDGLPNPPGANPPFPVADAPNELMSVLWEDYNPIATPPPSDSNRVYLFFDPSSKILTVEWFEVKHYETLYTYSFMTTLQLGGQELLKGTGHTGGVFFSEHLIHFLYHRAPHGWDTHDPATGIEDYYGEKGIYYQGDIDTDGDDFHVVRSGYYRAFTYNATAISILTPDSLVATLIPIEPKVVAANIGREAMDVGAQLDIFDSTMQAVYTHPFPWQHYTSGEFDTLIGAPWTPGDTGEIYTVRFWVNTFVDESSYNDTIYKQVRVIEGGIEEHTQRVGFEFNALPLADGRFILDFTLPYPSRVKIALYDTGGLKVADLTDRTYERGSHTHIWNGVDVKGQGVSQGVYLVRMEVDGWSATRKLVVLE